LGSGRDQVCSHYDYVKKSAASDLFTLPLHDALPICGYIVHSGSLDGLKDNTDSLTGDYLTGRKEIVIPPKRRPVEKDRQVEVVGARENNLQNVSAKFPLGVFTAVTGVSGSGKSTLVNEILYKVLANELNNARHVPGRHRRVNGLDQLDKVVHVDQSPIGRTPRSNAATYTGV